MSRLAPLYAICRANGRWEAAINEMAADGLRFHARDGVSGQNGKNVVQRVACGGGIDKMVAEEPRLCVRDDVWRQNDQNAIRDGVCQEFCVRVV